MPNQVRWDDPGWDEDGMRMGLGSDRLGSAPLLQTFPKSSPWAARRCP